MLKEWRSGHRSSDRLVCAFLVLGGGEAVGIVLLHLAQQIRLHCHRLIPSNRNWMVPGVVHFLNL